MRTAVLNLISSSSGADKGILYCENGEECFLCQSPETAMKLKFIVPISIFAAFYGLTGVLLLSPAWASDDEPKRDNGEEIEMTAEGQVIPFACYDSAGNVIFTTSNPQQTLGWGLGCREVQYESNNLDSGPAAYFQCFDVNGGVAFNTVDPQVARDSDLFCRKIGSRITTPMTARPTFYECFNVDGSTAFTTSYPQDTFGWNPGCREVQYRDAVLTQQVDTVQTTYECFDATGNVAFTTPDLQDAKRWKLGCRELRR
jgi:hypothetical protein